MCFISTGSHFEFVKCVPLIFDYICDSSQVIVEKNQFGIFVYDKCDNGLVAYRINSFCSTEDNNG